MSETRKTAAAEAVDDARERAGKTPSNMLRLLVTAGSRLPRHLLDRHEATKEDLRRRSRRLLRGAAMTVTKEEMLRFILEVAEKAGVKVAIGGGIAVNAHGYRRDTADVDAFFHYPDQRKVLRQIKNNSGRTSSSKSSTRPTG